MVQRRLESRVALRFGAGEAVLFGRARSAIAAVCEVIGLPRGAPFVIPATICPSIVAVAHALGLAVAPVDINPVIGLAGDDGMAGQIDALKGAGVVMPTHLYGFLGEYPKTIKAARARGWFVLENDTAGIRATDEGRGIAGDALVVSFGTGKVIDAGAGGAVLTDDPKFASALRERAQSYPFAGPEGDALEEWLTVVRRILRQGPPSGPSYAERYEYFLDLDAGQVHFRYDLRGADALDAALDAISQEADRRRTQHSAWARHLARLGRRIVVPTPKLMVPWRFIARLPGIRDAAAKSLRRANLYVGTNYPPVTDFFPRQLASWTLPGSDLWGREVINFWLDSRYDTAEMDLVAATLDRIHA